MSSPSDGNEKKDDHSAYAPKWVRDSNRETSHESPSIGEDKFPPAQRAVFFGERSGHRSGPRTSASRYDLHERRTAYSPGLEPTR